MLENQGQHEPIETKSVGMSLRDYFAAHAMPLFFQYAKEHPEQFSDGFPFDPVNHDEIAQNAYALADAMLEQKEV